LTYFLVLFNYSSKISKPVLEFLNTEKPVLKIDTGIESPTQNGK
jgi:hypothetical protein